MAKRSTAHRNAQREGRKRDNNGCQICGSTIDPEGHHIIDVYFSGAANSDNIITLCKKHHQDVHKGLIDIIKF